MKKAPFVVPHNSFHPMWSDFVLQGRSFIRPRQVITRIGGAAQQA